MPTTKSLSALYVLLITTLINAKNVTIDYPQDFDCNMRSFALEFAQYIQPNLSQDQLQEIVDALNGAPEAQNCNISIHDLPIEKRPKNKHRSPSQWKDTIFNTIDIEYTFFVDPINGNDNDHNGDINQPFLTITKALTTIRKLRKGIVPDKYYRIALRKGRHYLSNTIDFDHKDSFLIITNHDNEPADISGGIPLKNLTWSVYKNNIYHAKLPSNIASFDGLRVNGKRGIRARYPNVESMEVYPPGFGSNITAQTYLPRIYGKSPEPEIFYQPDEFVRNDSVGNDFFYYTLGIGGQSCFNFIPNGAYWCMISLSLHVYQQICNLFE